MLRRRSGIELKSPEQLVSMRRAGLVVAAALQAAASAVKPGVSTTELDAVAASVIRSSGATPSFLGYHGFPAVTCISVDAEIVHGIPGSRVLAEGDSVSIDCGAIVDGWHGDSAVTVQVGSGSESARALSESTRLAMWHGIAAARLGGTVGDVSAAIQGFVRGLATPYGIVEEYTGHGIGSAMHQPPDVPNLGRAGKGPKIVPGMALAIEPMLTAGDPANSVLDDDWTVVTDDGSLACHWEHTITVTEHGVWVLTSPDGGEAMLSEFGVPFGPLAD
ncbi:MAG TPA: type I methionyl aminopeptidase [Microlunatus sp.]|nr:type I methionyl aminopeptidase [Microlunatus sp.]